MSAIGTGIDLDLSQRAGAPFISLMPAQTVMLVAGDSLAAQAANGSQHPLMWAVRKGAFDLNFNFRLHNIGVGSTTTDANATPINVSNPKPESPKAGLIHPDRIARDTGYVTSTGAKVLLLDVGTNSVPNGGAATPFANVQSYVQAMRAAGIERVIVGTLQPRMSGTATPTVYMSTTQAQRCRDFNALLLAWAASDSAIHVYDGSAREVDPAKTAEYGPIGDGSNTLPGSSTVDGVHWGAAHSARREDELVAALGKIFPVRAARPYSTAAEYNWSLNRYRNILGAQAGFSGAGSRNPATGGPTGSFGAGWIGNSGVALPSGITVVGSQVQILYDAQLRDAVKVTFSGTPANDFNFMLQKSVAVPVGTDADNKLRMDGSEKLLHEWTFELDELGGCNGIVADLLIGAPGAVGNNMAGGARFLPVLDGRYVWREPSGSPVTAANTSCTPRLILSFRGGHPASGSITFIHAFLGHVA
jgi:hypothetical protein